MGGLKETDDEVVWEGVGVFGVGRKAVIGAVEWKGGEADGGVLGDGGLEGGDVAGGGDDSDGEAGFLLEKGGKGDERDHMALGHEGEEDYMSSFFNHGLEFG